MDVSVVVATYGDASWAELAQSRALPSVPKDVPRVVVHGESLHDARNAGLARVQTEFVCFLDADDELEPCYFTEIATSTADLRVPAVRYKRNGFDQGVRMPKVAGHTHDCAAVCLVDGNWMVIGTVAPTQLLIDVGGFRDFPWSEDWDLWLRCWRAGATIEAVPSAIYRAHVRRNSRNRGADQQTKNAAHRAIAHANGLLSPV